MMETALTIYLAVLCVFSVLLLGWTIKTHRRNKKEHHNIFIDPDSWGDQ